MEFSRQEYGVGCHSLLQGIFLNPGIKSGSPGFQADSLPLNHQAKPLRLTKGSVKGAWDSWLSRAVATPCGGNDPQLRPRPRPAPPPGELLFLRRGGSTGGGWGARPPFGPATRGRRAPSRLRRRYPDRRFHSGHRDWGMLSSQLSELQGDGAHTPWGTLPVSTRRGRCISKEVPVSR